MHCSCIDQQNTAKLKEAELMEVRAKRWTKSCGRADPESVAVARRAIWECRGGAMFDATLQDELTVHQWQRAVGSSQSPNYQVFV